MEAKDVTTDSANLVVKLPASATLPDDGWSRYRITRCPKVAPSTSDTGCSTSDCANGGEPTTDAAGMTCPLSDLAAGTAYTVEVRWEGGQVACCVLCCPAFMTRCTGRRFATNPSCAAPHPTLLPRRCAPAHPLPLRVPPWQVLAVTVDGSDKVIEMSSVSTQEEFTTLSGTSPSSSPSPPAPDNFEITSVDQCADCKSCLTAAVSLSNTIKQRDVSMHANDGRETCAQVRDALGSSCIECIETRHLVAELLNFLHSTNDIAGWWELCNLQESF